MNLMLDRYRHAELGLAPLVAAAAEILSAIGRSVGDDRVTDRPDARTLRYYQSLGVLDRPVRYDGREAVYGYRHLLQVVATKLLQAEGQTLAQVQRALAGRGTDALEAAVAGALPADAPAEPEGAHVPTHLHAPVPTPRALLTRELAPGVLVTVDPALVSDPEALLARLRRALPLPPQGATR